ncbi:MAG: hypothetical protein ABI600_03120 [Luteolibacter sp.]
MNSEPYEIDASKTAFAKLFATGLLGCVIGSLALFVAAWPLGHAESVAPAMMWAISYWWMAFAFGAVLLVLRGLLSRLSISTALAAYLLPAAALMAIVGICLAIYPDPGFRSDLFGFLPLVLIFHILGFLWMTFAKSGTANTAFLRSVLPAIVGGAIILGLVAVPVFSSNSFIYRNAFGLVVTKRAISNGAMIADAVLEIRKSGNYDFAAPRYSYPNNEEEANSDSPIELGKITWGPAGTPKEGVPGIYPLQIRWERNIPTTLPKSPAPYSDEDMVYLEVRNPSNATKDLIYNISANLPPVP